MLDRSLIVRLTVVLVAMVSFVYDVPTASAGGIEWPGVGTRALGRAGAFRARTDSAMALHLNPANLARLSGTNLELSIHLGRLNACFDRSGTPLADDNGGARPQAVLPNTEAVFGDEAVYGNLQYPEVCNAGSFGVVPQAAVTFRPHRRVGFGFGLIAPNNPAGERSFGREDGTIASDDTANGRLPSPTRYDVVNTNVLLAWVAAGVGVEIHPRLRLGASFGWGFARISYITNTAPVAGESVLIDINATYDASDIFVPRVAASIAAEPIDGLDIMAQYIYVQDVRGNGDLSLQTYHFSTQASIDALNLSQPTEATYRASIHAPQASYFNFAMRYGHQRARGTEFADDDVRDFDPMRDEVFDIELDLVLSFGNNVDAYRLRGSAPDDFNNRLETGTPITLVNAPGLELTYNWKTQVGIFVGGDWNVLPERLALRMGIAYENDGIQPGHERLSFMPWRRIGASLGATMRIDEFEISLGYMYLHWFTRTNTEEQARTTQATITGGSVLSAGRYTARANVLSISLAYRIP